MCPLNALRKKHHETFSKRPLWGLASRVVPRANGRTICSQPRWLARVHVSPPGPGVLGGEPPWQVRATPLPQVAGGRAAAPASKRVRIVSPTPTSSPRSHMPRPPSSTPGAPSANAGGPTGHRSGRSVSHNKRTPRGERAWPAPPRPGFPRPRPRPRGNRSRATASRYPEGGGGRGDNNPAAGGGRAGPKPGRGGGERRGAERQDSEGRGSGPVPPRHWSAPPLRPPLIGQCSNSVSRRQRRCFSGETAIPG